jgi:ribosomal protein S18 acetylase RimI-like enzyme
MDSSKRPSIHGLASRPTPAIRRATLADAAPLAEFGARTFRDTFAADNTPEDMDAYLSASFGPDIQRAQLSDPRVIVIIAEIDAALAGYAMLSSGEVPECIASSSAVELVRLYAAKEWLGRGVGDALMGACLDAARGYETIWLGVWERNHRAQAFYRRWGFRLAGTHAFLLGDDRQTDLVMERKILSEEP